MEFKLKRLYSFVIAIVLLFTITVPALAKDDILYTVTDGTPLTGNFAIFINTSPTSTGTTGPVNVQTGTINMSEQFQDYAESLAADEFENKIKEDKAKILAELQEKLNGKASDMLQPFLRQSNALSVDNLEPYKIITDENGNEQILYSKTFDDDFASIDYNALERQSSLTQPQYYTVGETKTVAVMVGNTPYRGTMQCKYVGNYCTVWSLVGDSTPPQLTYKAVADSFDYSVYSKMVTNYGAVNDVDRDGKLAIFYYNLPETGIGGYFWSGDMVGTYFPPTDGIHIDNTYNSSIAISTLAHEMQHAANFSYKYNNRLNQPESWVNEMLSESTEYVIFGENPSGRLNTYNTDLYKRFAKGKPVATWEGSLDDYAMVSLFGNYLRIHTNSTIFSEILKSSDSGYLAIEKAWKKYYPSSSWEDLITKFRIALVAKEASGLYGFKGNSFYNGIKVHNYSIAGSQNIMLQTGIYKGGGAAVAVKTTMPFTPSSSMSSFVRAFGISAGVTVPETEYKVTIASMTNGTVRANPTSAKAGAFINLTVSPSFGYTLQPGSLKYNNTTITGTSFNMPSQNVTIYANFIKSSSESEDADDPIAPETDFAIVKNYTDNSIIITDYTGTADRVGIPPTIGGLPVKEIDSFAFSDKDVISVTIPSSVQKLGAFVFDCCYNLTRVKMGDNIKEIGMYSFSECISLTTVKLPKALTQISQGLFYKSKSFKNAIVFENVNSVVESAFSDVSEDLTIYGIANSFIHTYARYSGIPFVVYTETVPAGKVAFAVQKATGAAGAEVTVPINITTNNGFSGATLSFAYDSTKLEYVSTEKGSLLSSANTSYNNSGNTVKLISVSTSDIKTTGNMYNIVFKIKSGASGEITSNRLSVVELINSSYINVDSTISQGSIVIGGAFLLGDVNKDGVITSVDALMALKFASGSQTPTAEQKLSADMNGDGEITSADALKILRLASGSEKSLSDEELLKSLYEDIAPEEQENIVVE